jgi:hypothetical protein
VAAGWTAHAVLGPFGATEVVASTPPPAFVEEAVRAHKTTLLRDTMASQPETETFDPAEIRSATAIVLPDLPKGWGVIDTQVFPSAYGPSVELVLEPRKGERLSLFAVRPGSFGVQHVLLFHADNARAAYWQIGDVAYALVSESRKGRRPGGNRARSFAHALLINRVQTEGVIRWIPYNSDLATARRRSRPPSSTRACASTCCVSTTTWAPAL